MKKCAVGVLLCMSMLSASAFAQHAEHAHGHAAQETESAAVKAYRAVNDQMHAGMDIEFTGDADIDFLKGMIPHHEGAVAMAKVVLEHGTDELVRKLAEEVIAAQEAEIEMMRGWLTERGH